MTNKQKFIDLLLENGFKYIDDITLEKGNIMTRADGGGEIQLIPENAVLLIAMSTLSLMLKRNK